MVLPWGLIRRRKHEAENRQSPYNAARHFFYLIIWGIYMTGPQSKKDPALTKRNYIAT